MRSFQDFDGFLAWAMERAAALAMEVEPCPLGELAPDWVVGDSIARPDGGFFTVEGRRIVRAAGREISGWKQPLIAKETAGFVAFLRTNNHFSPSGRDGFLVRVKAEPGNYGIQLPGDLDSCVLVAPPVQFSKGNLANHERALRGENDAQGRPIKRVPFASAALPKPPSWVRNVVWEDGVEDGGRFDKKRNRYGRISITDPAHILDEVALTGAVDDFAWVDLPLLREIRRHGLGNGFLRSALSMLI